MKNIKLSLACLFFAAGLYLAGGVPSTFAQSSTTKLIHDKAVELEEAYRANQNETVVNLTYPKVIEKGGGREKMLAVLKRAADMVNKGGVKVTSIDVGEPSEPVSGGSQLFSTVPVDLHMTLPDGTAESPGYLLAVSDDRGKNWTFVSGDALSRTKPESIFPNFPLTLKLPEVQPPTFTHPH